MAPHKRLADQAALQPAPLHSDQQPLPRFSIGVNSDSADLLRKTSTFLQLKSKTTMTVAQRERSLCDRAARVQTSRIQGEFGDDGADDLEVMWKGRIGDDGAPQKQLSKLAVSVQLDAFTKAERSCFVSQSVIELRTRVPYRCSDAAAELRC